MVWQSSKKYQFLGIFDQKSPKYRPINVKFGTTLPLWGKKTQNHHLSKFSSGCAASYKTTCSRPTETLAYLIMCGLVREEEVYGVISYCPEWHQSLLTLIRCCASAVVMPCNWTSFQMHVLLRLFMWPVHTHNTFHVATDALLKWC